MAPQSAGVGRAPAHFGGVSQSFEAFDAVLGFGWGAEQFAEAVRERVQAFGETARVGRGVIEDAQQCFVAFREPPG